MSPVFKNLNLKDQAETLILDAPQSFEGEIRGLKGVKVGLAQIKVEEIRFALAFVTKRKELNEVARFISKKSKGDDVGKAKAKKK